MNKWLNMQKKSRGVGKYQIDKSQKSLMLILRVLSDGKQHQNKEIKKLTGLNDPTLAKYLNRLKEIKAIEKTVDIESGKYPYPVYYKAKDNFLAQIKILIITEQEKQEIEKIIRDPKKTPLDVLDQINTKNNSLLLLALKNYKENKNASEDIINFVLEIAVWNPYKILTSYLIESSKKIIEEIDVDELIERNQSTIRLDKLMLRDLGFSEKQAEQVIEKYTKETEGK